MVADASYDAPCCNAFVLFSAAKRYLCVSVASLYHNLSESVTEREPSTKRHAAATGTSTLFFEYVPQSRSTVSPMPHD